MAENFVLFSVVNVKIFRFERVKIPLYPLGYAHVHCGKCDRIELA